MLAQETGEYVHGEFHGASTTGGEIILYGVDGNARALGSDERLVVTDAQAVFSSAGDGYIYFDATDTDTISPGETVVRGSFAASGGISVSYNGVPRWGQKGAKPHVGGPSGAIDAVLTGFIINQ